MLRHAAQRHRRCATLAAMAALLVAMLTLASGTAAPIAPKPGYLDETLDSLNGTYGFAPAEDAPLIMDATGNLYGANTYGTNPGYGAVFELTRNPAGWAQNLLYSFCSQSNCSDGAVPNGLIMDSSGNLYGTTQYGGAQNSGVAFELTPNQSRTAWTETVLYNFCSQSNCADGAGPFESLVMDSSGNLYGATRSGGACPNEPNCGGVIFELTSNHSRTAWAETVLYSFCSLENCADGEAPNGGLIMDNAGNLYGTTSFGGSDYLGPLNGGVVFELTPPIPPSAAWTYAMLYSFYTYCDVTCFDGLHPAASLIMDAAGNLYGTTSSGGLVNDGVVFELMPNQDRTAWTESLLYDFTGADGSGPVAGLMFDCGRIGLSQQATPSCDRQTLIGTTQYGGSHGQGTVFALTPNLSRTVWTESVLHSFCSQSNCADGEQPLSGVIADALGNLYGTTLAGGSANGGVVFKLIPPGMPVNPLLPPPIASASMAAPTPPQSVAAPSAPLGKPSGGLNALRQ